MAIPKRRKSSSARDKRRSHLHLKKLNLVVCKHCGAKTLPHQVCKDCGYYGEIMVKDIVKRQAKKDQRVQKELDKRKKEEAKEQKSSPQETGGLTPSSGDDKAKKVQV